MSAHNKLFRFRASKKAERRKLVICKVNEAKQKAQYKEKAQQTIGSVAQLVRAHP